jgi:hypothetical protein
MFPSLHLDFNYLKSGLLHLTGQPNSKKGRAKVKDGIISGAIFLRTTSVDQYNIVQAQVSTKQSKEQQIPDLPTKYQGPTIIKLLTGTPNYEKHVLLGLNQVYY